MGGKAGGPGILVMQFGIATGTMGKQSKSRCHLGFEPAGFGAVANLHRVLYV